MKRIAIISNSASSLLNFRKDLIKYLVGMDFEVFGLAIDFSAETKIELKDLGASPVSYTLDRGGLNPFADLMGLNKLSRIIREIKPDIVFSTFVKPVIFGTMAARKAGVPRVVGMLEGLGYCFTDQPEGLSLKARIIKKVQVLLYKIAIPKLDLLIFLNQDDPADLLERYAIKTKQYRVLGAIGLSLTDYPFSAPAQHPVTFIFVGRLLKEKGIFEFLQASEIVKEKYPETEIIVLGDVDSENPGSIKQNQFDSYVASKTIRQLGYVDNVAAWFQQSSVFVLPSYREGLPRTSQEAQAIGRAVITTDVPGCRETVIDGYNGFLVPRWSADALAEKMIYFIEHPEAITLMGANAYQFAKEHYDAEIVNKRLFQMITE
ncbi:MAG TPA: glycosyltransferase family 4 protein [Niabella sp.]|nr:glycosyltransferase family 4 protein [Niabella sp.]HOZ97366.1 glycosyltransferase family 4 protein [Niabella sp.]HQW15363.1 glycosyltransferase family 4 protein [Niabella sp.]HQX20591.1 glycosyltransferase family 4 protein [Niabella sp.]HRB05824.1 glycosyltransferase family 4 protein [Niabella sp.]